MNLHCMYNDYEIVINYFLERNLEKIGFKNLYVKDLL